MSKTLIIDKLEKHAYEFCNIDDMIPVVKSEVVREMETALRKLIKVFPRNLSCNELHHSKNEYHADDKECPVVENTRKALEEAEQLLKRYE